VVSLPTVKVLEYQVIGRVTVGVLGLGVGPAPVLLVLPQVSGIGQGQKTHKIAYYRTRGLWF